MNFTQMKDYVSIQLDDLNKGYFTDSILGIYVNNAQYEAAKMVVLAGEGYVSKPVCTTLIQNQRDYVLPEDFFKLELLYIIQSGTAPNESTTELLELPPSQSLQITYGAGTPGAYFFKGNRLSIYPAPDAGSAGKELVLLYSPKPLPLVNGTDVSMVPIEYHEYICILAIIDGMLRDGRDPTSYIMKRDFYENKLRNAIERRSIARSRFVITSNDNYGDGEFFY